MNNETKKAKIIEDGQRVFIDDSDEPGPIQLLKYYWKQMEKNELKPVMVQWICTHQCNFRCSHCGTAASEAKPEELTTEQAFRMIDGCAELDTELFTMTGGEPILRPDIWDIIDRIHDDGMRTGFVTNGWAIEKYADKIEKAEVDSVLVSIDGYRENHDKIRGMPGSYQKCLEAIDFLKSIGVPIVGASTVYMKDNIDLLPKIVEEAASHGVDRHRLQAIVPEGRAKGKGNSPEEVKRAIKYIIEARVKGINIEVCEAHGYLGPVLDGRLRPNFFCGVGLNTMCVMHNGDVMGCSAIDFPEYSQGNVKEQDIGDIWRNGFADFRKEILPNLPSECTGCGHLTICRGGCWLHRVNDNYCFLPMAEQALEEFRKEHPEIVIE